MQLKGKARGPNEGRSPVSKGRRMQKQLSMGGAAAKTSLASNLEASAGQMGVLDT